MFLFRDIVLKGKVEKSIKMKLKVQDYSSSIDQPALASPAISCVCVQPPLRRLRMDFVSAAVALQQLVGAWGEKGKACE